MRINQNTAISTSKVFLVPYEESHVITYHEWMKDEEIQSATASEPLSIDEEFAMQQSWRADHDKLTFIACFPLDGSPKEILEGEQDPPRNMIGDVNLFLSAADEDPEGCTGELELMIARPSLRRNGYGRAAILAFLHYMQLHLEGILDEYRKGQSLNRVSLLRLKVKIGSKNEKSTRLFESIGFVMTGEGPNYFDEIELVLDGLLSEQQTDRLLRRYGIEKYREVHYMKATVKHGGSLTPRRKSNDLKGLSDIPT